MEELIGFEDEISLVNDAASTIRRAVADYLTIGSVDGLRDLLETAISDTL